VSFVEDMTKTALWPISQYAWQARCRSPIRTHPNFATSGSETDLKKMDVQNLGVIPSKKHGPKNCHFLVVL